MRRSVDALQARGEGLAIGLQVLAESWVVATRPTDANGIGWPPELAKQALTSARQRFTLLVDDSTTADRWFDLVTTGPVVGKRAHDARIVALMVSHGVSHILTLNDRDFAGMPGVVTVHPAAVVP